MSASNGFQCLLAALAIGIGISAGTANGQDSVKPLTGPVFFAAGEKGMRVFSQDGGKTWTHLQTDRDGVLLKHSCFLDGHCLAAGQYGGDRPAFATRDGVKWEALKLEGQPYATRLEMLFVSGKRFHAILHQDDSKYDVITSLDGAHWQPRQPILNDWKLLRYDTQMRRSAQGNGRIVLVGDYGVRLVRKLEADRFEVVPKTVAKDTLIDIAFGNGFFVGGGLHALRMRSQDGVTWTDRVVGEEGEHINSMIFDGKQFVGIGQGATYRSVDGQKWQRLPNVNAPTIAAFGAGVYVGALWPGKLLRSTDAVHWENAHILPHHVLSLSYGLLGSK